MLSLNPIQNRHSTLSALLGSVCIGSLVFGMTMTAKAETLITGPSPFGFCSADSVSTQPGSNYPDAEVEPWVDVSPLSSSHLIAGWQQDRWSNGGSRGLVSGYSNDSGATWTTVIVPGITLCSGGTFQRASDPWVTIAHDGTAYFMSLSFMNDEPSGAGGDNAILVNRSTDGGASWSSPVALIYDTDGQIFNDKNSMTADPTNAHFVYGVWDRLTDLSLPSATSPGIGKAHGGDGVANARAHRLRNLGGNTYNNRSFTGPVYFARTTNGGISWEPARMILDTGPNAQTIGNQIVVLKNGNVVDFFTHIYHNGDTTIGMVKSSDHGAHFGPEQTAVKMNETLKGTITPDAREPVRDANILFDVAADRDNGNIYLVWQDGRDQNIDRVAFSMSTNNGQSWSQPVIINQTPYSTNKLRNQAFIPAVEVGPHHRIVVTYYDFRNDTNNGQELTDMWSISCNPSTGTYCNTRYGWGSETRLSSDSFDMLQAPIAVGHFLGDYEGLVRAGDHVQAVFGKAVASNVTDMFAATVP